MATPPGGRSKAAVVTLLRNMAALLEFHGANPFKSRAFENGARALEQETAPLPELAGEPGRLESIKGIGKSIAAFIREAAGAGAVAEYDELRAATPPGVFEMLQIPNLGPKRLKTVCDSLGVKTIADLEQACKAGTVAELPGFGAKSAEKILAGIEQMQKHTGKSLLSVALAGATPLLEAVRTHKKVKRAELAGSLRRRREVIGDIDIVASSTAPDEVLQFFTRLPGVAEVIGQGDTKASVRLDNGMQADLRVVSDKEYPCALQYFTGSKEHNTLIRGRAKKMGLRVNEYGIFRVEGDAEPSEKDRVAVSDEKAFYKALGLAEMRPELREGLGEIEAAETGSLPDLIEAAHYRGVLHCHSTWSDGKAGIREMALAARDVHGLDYIAITDHSEAAAYAGGVKKADIPRQHDEIDALNEEFAKSGFRILKGCEVDIMADGSLDYPDSILETMDIVVASVHSRFQLPEKEMTARLVRAVRHPLTTILGHPSGRLLLTRDPYPFDLDAVLEVAAVSGTAVEINGDPRRLDLDWRYCRRAKELGVVFSINPDAHSVAAIANFHYGTAMARKGWLGPDDVINCLPLKKLHARIARLRTKKKAAGA